jgi:hypothetical protein
LNLLPFEKKYKFRPGPRDVHEQSTVGSEGFQKRLRSGMIVICGARTVAAIAGGKSASIHCHHTIKRADRF